jgi:hypothetical protein
VLWRGPGPGARVAATSPNDGQAGGVPRRSRLRRAGRCTRDRAEMSRMLRRYSQVTDSGRLLDRKSPRSEGPARRGSAIPSNKQPGHGYGAARVRSGRHVPASSHNSSLIPGTAAPARLHIRRLSEPAAAPACFCESATTKSGTAALFAVTGVGSPSMRIAGIQSSHGGKCQFQLAQDPGGVARECQPWLLSSHAASTSAESKIKGGRH